MTNGSTGVLLLALSLVDGGASAAQRDAVVVADFDAGKAEARSGLSMWLFADEQFGGTSEARVTVVHPGAASSPGALRIAFRVTDDFRTPFASAWAMVGPEGLATDLSAYRGVRFYARGEDGTAFTAGIVRFQGTVMRYTVPFQIKPGWTLVELPFDAFRPVPPPGGAAGSTPPLDPKNITSVGVAVSPDRRGQFELEIDRVEFYR